MVNARHLGSGPGLPRTSLGPEREPCHDEFSGTCALAGSPIANARGVPGSIGFIAVTLNEQRLVLVTAYHVLFGGGAGPGDPVWLMQGSQERPRTRLLGRARYGRRGVVSFDGASVYVDCGVAEIDERFATDAISGVGEPWRYSVGGVSPGDRVTKSGAGTGRTAGVVIDACCTDFPRVDGRDRTAPAQIRIRGEDKRRPFASGGDSGAAVALAGRGLVGLLRGVNARGDALASPIAPVSWVLQVRPVSVVSNRKPARSPVQR